MTKCFDISLFLSGALKGSKATQQRHLRQARIMHAAIQDRWQCRTPWAWKLKHIRWFLEQYLQELSKETQYRYSLTTKFIMARLGSDWKKLKTCKNQPNTMREKLPQKPKFKVHLKSKA